MATKLFTGDIDKNVDWGGDQEHTQGLPVCGEKVQKFIKDTLNQKFGSLYFDNEKLPEPYAQYTGTNQYIIFSDDADKAKWLKDPVTNAGLVLGRFDAPAPARILISNQSLISNNILLNNIGTRNEETGVSNTTIYFDYSIVDNSDQVQPSPITVNITISNATYGNVVLSPQTVPFTPKKDTNGEDVEGVAHYAKEIGEYLNEGTNIITVTVLSNLFNVSTTLMYTFNILDLQIRSTFNNDLADGEDSDNVYRAFKPISNKNESFTFGVTAISTGAKYLRVFIDGKQIKLRATATAQPSDDLYLGTDRQVDKNVIVYLADLDADMKTNTKHSLQFYFYANEDSLKSNTLYYDFVFTNGAGQDSKEFVLFNKELSAGKVLTSTEELFNLDCYQYDKIEIPYAVVKQNSTNPLTVNIRVINNDTVSEVYKESPEIGSGKKGEFRYTFLTSGNMSVIFDVNHNDETIIPSKVEPMDLGNVTEVIDDTLMLKLSAVNKNNLSNANSWEPEIISTYIEEAFNDAGGVQFSSNFAWTDKQNGWIDNTLVLNNNTTVTIPLNVFAQKSDAGLTFEIDFETRNVQDDAAIIMNYSGDSEDVIAEKDANDANAGKLKSTGILIKACEAQFRGSDVLTTNYKENARQKIQFIIVGNNDMNAGLMYIVVNGILDRVTTLDSNQLFNGQLNEFVIGNTNNMAETRIHGIRIYSKALSLDQCVNHYILDSDNVKTNYDKNNIYAENSTNINIDNLLNQNIPVMVIYGDISNSIEAKFDKKANVPVDVLYRDNLHPEFNFFALNAWMSNQGTSSMNYPRRNLRLYLNKKPDAKSVRGFAPTYAYDYETVFFPGLTTEEDITKLQQCTTIGAIDELATQILTNKHSKTPRYNSKTLKKKYYVVDQDLAREYVHAGIKLYTYVLNEETGEYEYKKLIPANFSEAFKDNGTVYAQGGWTKFMTKSLYTDRWTLKCDYAESSGTHNAGVGRLWGDVLQNTIISGSGFTYNVDGDRFSTDTPCKTNAQRAADQYNTDHQNDNDGQGYKYGDVRTSCDGYPIVIFNRPRKRDDNTGNIIPGEFNEIRFIGLYNIMTDKGSTPLFGFETLNEEDKGTIFDGGTNLDAKEVKIDGEKVEVTEHVHQRTECWECLQNGSQLAQMSTLITDEQDGSTATTNKDRLIWNTYEARWPDNDDLNDTLTNNLETFIRFINFCKDAVSVRVGEGDGKDGYNLSDYSQIDIDTATFLWDNRNNKSAIAETYPNLANWDGRLFLIVPATDYKDKSYPDFQTTNDDGIKVPKSLEEIVAVIQGQIDKGKNIIYFYQSYESGNVTGQSFAPLFDESTSVADRAQAIYDQLNSAQNQVFTESVSDDPSEIDYVLTSQAPEFGNKYAVFDNTYDRSIIKKVINTDTLKEPVRTARVATFDGKRVWNANDNQVKAGLKTAGDLRYPDGQADVTVYVTTENGKYYYTNEMGEKTPYTGPFESEEDYTGRTLMDYFSEKKSEHLDIWKVAAYYVYLMRFAAVDQVIKNTMMTTEDGKHYYFINYDNDTILGVRNDGFLVYDWQIDRTSYDESLGSYAYAGFGSVLWNLLEQDEDFMEKVQTVANAMVTSNALTYAIALDMFNVKQSGTWSERLYNRSQAYKYLSIYNNEYGDQKRVGNDRFLGFLQGSRRSHREWWLRHRFDLYDSKWRAGEYAQSFLTVYMQIDGSSERPFLDIEAASKYYFTVLSNGRLYGNNFVELNAGDKHTFIAPRGTGTTIGDPPQLLGAHKCRVIDFSPYRDMLSGVMSFDWTSDMSMVQEIILGGNTPEAGQPNGAANCGVTNINNLQNVISLQKLDIRTCKKLVTTNLPFDQLPNLKVLYADSSIITSFVGAKSNIYEEITLPSASLQTLKLEENEITTTFKYQPTSTLKNLSLKYVKGIDIPHLLFDWYKSIVTTTTSETFNGFTCTITLDSNDMLDLPKYIGASDMATEADDSADVILIDLQTVRNLSEEQRIALGGQDDYEKAVNYWKQQISLEENANKDVRLHSLIWLVAMRRAFGTNSQGKHNFDFVDSAIIKLWGSTNSTNAKEDGKLTEEDYNLLIDESLFGPSYMSSTSSVRFEAACTSQVTFISIIEDEKVVLPKKETIFDVYRLNSGSTATIVATIFPMGGGETLEFAPVLCGGASGWTPMADSFDRTVVDGQVVYVRNGQIDEHEKSASRLTNRLQDAELYIGEFIGTQKDTTVNMRIDIIKKVDQELTPTGKYINIAVNKIIPPENSQINIEDNATHQIVTNVTLTKAQTYLYDIYYDLGADNTLEFINLKVRNISIGYDLTGSGITLDQIGLIGTFTAQPVTGKLIVENNRIKLGTIKYDALIHKSDIEFGIIITIDYESVENNINNAKILRYNIINNPIDNIDIVVNDTKLDKENLTYSELADKLDQNNLPQGNILEQIGSDYGQDTNQTINYIELTQYLRTTESVNYDYNLVFDEEEGFNIEIKSISVTDISGELNTNVILNKNNVLRDKKFTLQFNDNKFSSVYEGYILITLADEFNRLTYLVIKYDVGMLYPDQYVIYKQDSYDTIGSIDSTTAKYIISNGTISNSTTLDTYVLNEQNSENALKQKNIRYTIKIASLVNGNTTEWESINGIDNKVLTDYTSQFALRSNSNNIIIDDNPNQSENGWNSNETNTINYVHTNNQDDAIYTENGTKIGFVFNLLTKYGYNTTKRETIYIDITRQLSGITDEIKYYNNIYKVLAKYINGEKPTQAGVYVFDDKLNLYNTNVPNNGLIGNSIEGICIAIERSGEIISYTIDKDCFSTNNKKVFFNSTSQFAQVISAHPASQNNVPKVIDNGNHTNSPQYYLNTLMPFITRFNQSGQAEVNARDWNQHWFMHGYSVLWIMICYLNDDTINDLYQTKIFDGDPFNYIAIDNIDDGLDSRYITLNDGLYWNQQKQIMTIINEHIDELIASNKLYEYIYNWYCFVTTMFYNVDNNNQRIISSANNDISIMVSSVSTLKSTVNNGAIAGYNGTNTIDKITNNTTLDVLYKLFAYKKYMKNNPNTRQTYVQTNSVIGLHDKYVNNMGTNTIIYNSVQISNLIKELPSLTTQLGDACGKFGPSGTYSIDNLFYSGTNTENQLSRYLDQYHTLNTVTLSSTYPGLATTADSKFRTNAAPIEVTGDNNYKVYWTEDSLLNYGYPNGEIFYINEYEFVPNTGLVGLGAWLFSTGTEGITLTQLVDDFRVVGTSNEINNLPVNNNYKLSVIYGPELKG